MAEEKFQGERPPADVGERVIDVPGLVNEEQATKIVRDPTSEVGKTIAQLQKSGKDVKVRWKAGEIHIIVAGVAGVIGLLGGAAIEHFIETKTGERRSKEKKRKTTKKGSPRRKR